MTKLEAEEALLFIGPRRTFFYYLCSFSLFTFFRYGLELAASRMLQISIGDDHHSPSITSSARLPYFSNKQNLWVRRERVTYLRRDAEHLEAGRHVGQLRPGQHHVAEVDGEGLAPHREVPDVEHGQFLDHKLPLLRMRSVWGSNP